MSLCALVSLQILHSTGLEFQHQVQEAKDLDQLIKIHYRYLATIHDRCLLREKVNSGTFLQLEAASEGPLNSHTSYTCTMFSSYHLVLLLF